MGDTTNNKLRRATNLDQLCELVAGESYKTAITNVGNFGTCVAIGLGIGKVTSKLTKDFSTTDKLLSFAVAAGLGVSISIVTNTSILATSSFFRLGWLTSLSMG